MVFSSDSLMQVKGAKKSVSFGWYLSVFLICLIIVSPIVALIVVAFSGEDNIWPHLISTVLPKSIVETLLLMLGVGMVTGVVGVGTAWLVTMCRFPGYRFFRWALVIPLATPTYLVAFCYLELLDYSGWIQTGLRAIFGWQSASDYSFPEYRSLPGVILVMSFVLYPYVYLTSRASFIQQSVCALEVSRTLGRSAWGAFWYVGLPMARPALVAGVTLALMECLNDVGAVEFFGVNTLTVSVYSTWLERSSLSGAAQISSVMLLFVVALLAVERWSRRGQVFHSVSNVDRDLPSIRLSGWRALITAILCALPIILGFVLPALILVDATLVHWREFLEGPILTHAYHSVLMAGAAAIIAVILGFLIAYSGRLAATKSIDLLARMASVGYAIPGTILAIGLLVCFSAFENLVGTVSEGIFGITTGLIISGTSMAIVFAYVVRFMAISYGTMEAGMSRVSPNLDAVGRSLGQSPSKLLFSVHLPILRPVIGAAALLVFVDAMKELPATLLLRPFNFDTLATHVYTLASLDLFEESAPAALGIVLIGLVPVIVLNQVVSNGRTAKRG